MKFLQKKRDSWSDIMGQICESMAKSKLTHDVQTNIELFTETEAIMEAERRKCIVAFYQ